MRKILVISVLCVICVFGATPVFSRQAPHSPERPVPQKITPDYSTAENLIAAQSEAPTLSGLKRLFSLYSNGPEPAKQYIDASISRLKLPDDGPEWLKTEAAASPNKDIRRLAFRIASRHPSGALNLEFARIFLYDPDKDIRLENINHIRKLPGASVLSLLSAALTDGYYPVRKSALETLSKYNNNLQAVETVIQRYPDETSLTLRFEMEEAVIRGVKQSGNIDMLIKHLDSEQAPVRALAARALGRCAAPPKTESAIKSLTIRLNDSDAEARASKEWALRRLKNPGIKMDRFDLKPPAGKATLPYMANRFEPNRAAMLLKYGGNQNTETAARLGLDWLARNQEPDGSWNCVKHNPWHENVVLPAFTTEDELIDVSLTGLALLCFMGDGSTHQSGPYQSHINKGLDFIKSAQDVTGCINIPKSHIHNERCLVHGQDHGKLPRRYNHNISTLALIELYGLTGDTGIKELAQRALEHSKNTPEPGFPWSFYLEPTDMGPSIFYILALRLARETGLLVPEKEIARAKTYLSRLTDQTSGRIVHICPIPICFGGMDSTASGLFGHILINSAETAKAKSDPALINKSAGWLSQFPPKWEPFYQYTDYYPSLLYLENNIMNEWHWYYQTMSFRHLGGDYWTDWNQKHSELLLRYQRQGGLLDGSWDPEGPWATIGGRVYSTAFSVLSLQAYYSYSFNK